MSDIRFVKVPAGGITSPLTTKGDVFTHDGGSDARFGTGGPTFDGYEIVADNSQAEGLRWRRQLPLVVTMCMFTSDTAWTNMPSNLQVFIANNYRMIHEVDLAEYQQVRFVGVRRSSAGSATAFLELRYATTLTNSPGSYLQIGETAALQWDITGTNTFLDTGWEDLASGAKADGRFIAIVGDDGGGGFDPDFGTIQAQFR